MRRTVPVSDLEGRRKLIRRGYRCLSPDTAKQIDLGLKPRRCHLCLMVGPHGLTAPDEGAPASRQRRSMGNQLMTSGDLCILPTGPPPNVQRLLRKFMNGFEQGAYPPSFSPTRLPIRMVVGGVMGNILLHRIRSWHPSKRCAGQTSFA